MWSDIEGGPIDKQSTLGGSPSPSFSSTTSRHEELVQSHRCSDKMSIQLKILTEENEALTREKDEMVVGLSSVKIKLNQAEDLLRNMSHEFGIERSKLADQLEKANVKITIIGKDKEALEAHMHNIKKDNYKSAKTEEYENTIGRLADEITSYRSKYEASILDFQSLQVELASMQQTHKETESKYEQSIKSLETELNGTCSKFEGQKLEMVSELRDIRDKYDKTMSEASRYRKAKGKLSADFTALHDQFEKLKIQYEAYKSHAQSEISQLKEQLEVSKTEAETYKNSNSTAEKELVTIKEQYNKLKETHSKLKKTSKKEIEKLAEALNKRGNEVKKIAGNTATEIKRLKSQFSDKESEMQQLREEIKEHQHRLSSTIEERDSTSSTLVSKEHQMQELKQTVISLEQTVNEIEPYKAQANDLQTALTNTNGLCDTLRKEIQTLKCSGKSTRQKYEETKAKVKTAKTDLMVLREQLTLLEGEKNEITDNHNALVEDKVKLCQTNMELRSELNRAKVTIESLTSDNRDLQGTVEQRLGELEGIQGAFTALQSKHDHLKDKTDRTFDKLQKDLDESKKKYEIAQSDAKRTEKARIKLQAELSLTSKQFESLVAEKDQIMDEKRKLVSELSTVKQTNYKLKTEFDLAKEKLDNEIADLRETLETSELDRQEVMEKKIEIEEEMRKVSKQCEETMENYNNYKEYAEGETEEVKSTLKKRSSELKRLVEVISESNREIEDLRKEVDQKNKNIESLNGKVENVNRELEYALEERRKLLKNVLELTSDVSTAKTKCGSLEKTVTELEVYKDKAEDLQIDVDNLNMKCKRYEIEIEERKTNEIHLKEDIQQMKQDLLELGDTYEICLKEKDTYIRLERDTRTKLDETLAEKDEADGMVSNLNTELTELKIQYDECEQEMEKYMKLEKETRHKLTDATKEMERAASTVKDLHSEVKAVNNKYETCLAEKENVMKSEKETIIELHKVRAEKDIIQLQEQEISEKLQEMIEECEQSKSAEQEAVKKLQDLLTEKESLQGHMKGLEMQFRKLEGDYKGLATKCEQIQEQKQNIEKKKDFISSEKDSVQSRLLTVEGDINELRYRFKCIQSEYEDLEETKEMLDSERQLFVTKMEIILAHVQEWGLELEGSDLLEKFADNKEIALDLAIRRIDEMKTKYDACEMQMEKVMGEMGNQIANLQEDLKSTRMEKDIICEERDSKDSELKELRHKLEHEELMSSRTSTPVGGDGVKLTFDGLKQRNKVLEHSYRSLINKYDKLKKAHENGESFLDDSESFLDDELLVTVLANDTDKNSHEFKMLDLQKKELEKTLQLRDIEYHQRVDELEHETGDLKTLLDSASKMRERMEAEMTKQKGEFEIALAKSRSEALLRYIDSDHEREQIVERMTEASSKIGELEEHLKLAEEERDLHTLKVAHMKKECDLYEKHIADLEIQIDIQQTQVREAMSEHKETITMLGELQMQQDLLRREHKQDLSEIKGEFSRLGKQVSQSHKTRIHMLAAPPSSQQLALPSTPHRPFDGDTRIDNLDEGHKALQIKHFKMVEDVSRMERELKETKDQYERENALLREELTLEKERGRRDVTLAPGQTYKFSESSHQTKSVKGYITDTGEFGYSTEMLAVKERLIALEQNNQSIQSENRTLKEKLRQQEELVMRIQHDVSGTSEGSALTQPKLDVTQDLISILQEQRDELLGKISEQREMNQQFAEVREEKNYLDASLKRERRMWKEKVREKESVEIELLAERLGRQKNIKAYRQLEDMINKMGEIERKLATEKAEMSGYELYDEDIEISSIKPGPSSKAEKLERARDAMVAKLARKVGYKELAIQTDPTTEDEQNSFSSQSSYRRERRAKLGCGCRLDPDTLELRAACPYHRVVEKLRVNLRDGRGDSSVLSTPLGSPRVGSPLRSSSPMPLAASTPRSPATTRNGRLFFLTTS